MIVTVYTVAYADMGFCLVTDYCSDQSQFLIILTCIVFMMYIASYVLKLFKNLVILAYKKILCIKE